VRRTFIHGTDFKLVLNEVENEEVDVHNVSIRKEGLIGTRRTVNALNWVTDRAYGVKQKERFDETGEQIAKMAEDRLCSFLAHEITHWFGIGDTYARGESGDPVCENRPIRGAKNDILDKNNNYIRGRIAYLMGYSWIPPKYLNLHPEEIERILEPLCEL